MKFESIASHTYNIGTPPPLTKLGNVDWNRANSYIYFDGEPNAGLKRRRDLEFYHAQLLDF